jgi:peptidoglycan hydrolase CwlO-like protein
MSRIWGIVVGLCAVIGVGAIVFHFAGARGDVAKKKVLGQIDKWLGESDVQRQEIENGIKGMEVAVDKLSTAKIKARVDADRLTKAVKENQKKVEDSKASLVRLRDDLKKFDTDTTYSVTVGGKVYNKKEDLNKLAEKVIDYHKSLTADTKKMEERLETYDKTASTLESRHDEAKKKLKEMKEQLKDLDSKIEMVKAQREAAEALNETDKTFADSVKGIQDKINLLDASTETAARKEAEKWNEMTVKTESEDVSKIIKDTKSTSDEIDALLGNK